LHKRNWR